MKRLFLDLETTGRDFKRCGIHQMSGIIDIDGEIVNTFDFKIKPFKKALIEEEALKLTNLSLETFENPEYLPEFIVIGKLITIFDTYIDKFDKKDKFTLIGYNIHFDFNFIINFFERNKNQHLFSYIWKSPIDVMSMAMETFEERRSDFEKFNLMYVAEKCGIYLNTAEAHRSDYDIDITRQLFYYIKDYNNLVVLNKLKFLNTFQKSIPAYVKTIPNNDFVEPIPTVVEPIPTVSEPIPTVAEPIPTVAEPIPTHDFDKLKSSFLTDNLNNMQTPAMPTSEAPKKLLKVNDESFVFHFGKYKNHSVEEVLKKEATYIIWVHDNKIQGIEFGLEIRDKAIKNSTIQKKEYFEANKNRSGGKSADSKYFPNSLDRDNQIPEPFWPDDNDDLPF